MANILKTTSVLTRRERQVCELVCQGKSNKDIARQLEISPRTIEDHRLGFWEDERAELVALVHKVLSRPDC
jgi:FixJ family two-component response regulator